MSCRERFLGKYLRIIDCLETALAGQITIYKDFYLRFEAAVDPFSLSDAELREDKTLASHYPSELNANVYPRVSQTGPSTPLGDHGAVL